MTKSGNEFHSLIAEGKKENKYVLLLAAILRTMQLFV